MLIVCTFSVPISADKGYTVLNSQLFTSFSLELSSNVNMNQG